MLLDEKTLNKYESMPKRISSSSIYIENDWWDDKFQKSRDQLYGIASNYAEKVLKKNLGRPAGPVIYKLKSHPEYKKKHAFRKAIDDSIEFLIKEMPYEKYGECYYSDNGLIAYHPGGSSFDYKAWNRSEFLNIVDRFHFNDGFGITNYIVRVYGIYYYISEEGYYYVSYYVSTRKPSKVLSLPYVMVPLQKVDIEHYNLRTLKYYDKEWYYERRLNRFGIDFQYQNS